LETQLKEAGNFKNQFETITTELNTLKTSIPVYEKKVVEAKRDLISMQYGVEPKLLEGKTEAELDTLKEAMKIAGKGSRAGAGTFYDRGSSSGTPSSQPFATELKELDELKRK
jgi:hypothetical protein